MNWLQVRGNGSDELRRLILEVIYLTQFLRIHNIRELHFQFQRQLTYEGLLIRHIHGMFVV